MLVDVALPVYQGKRWLPAAIDSVLAQTYPHWRLTIVDDASPDDTLAYAQALYAQRDERIRFLRLEAGRRAPGARMAALAGEEGDLIAFLDQDDVWHPEKLARQVACLQASPRAAVAHTDVRHIDGAGQEIAGSARRENAFRAGIPYDALDREALTRQLFLRNSIRLVSAVVRRAAFVQVGGFDGLPFGAEDWGLWVRLAAAGFGVVHLPEPLVDRRLHGENVSVRQRLQRNQGLWQGMEMMAAHFPWLAAEMPARQSHLLRDDILTLLAAGKGPQARPQIRQYIDLGHAAAGWALWAFSFLGPLQPPLLRLARWAAHQRP